MGRDVMKKRKPIVCCPHCGGTDGIFTKTTLRGVRHFCGFAGEEQDNTEMYDSAVPEGGRIAYCQECGKAICRMSALEKQWEGKK